MAALQSDDGHWPAENSGCMFFNAPFVSCTLKYPLFFVIRYYLGFIQTKIAENCLHK